MSEVYFNNDTAGESQESLRRIGNLLGDRHGWVKDQTQGIRGDILGFDTARRWSDQHGLLRVEASGQWDNLPVC